jgi:hypothetical protein
MKIQNITTSAILHFAPPANQSVPLRWLEAARNLFTEFNLSPILFTAFGGTFLYDDCYVLAKHGNDLIKFSEVLPAREGELIEALQRDQIKSLALDSPQPDGDDRENWRAKVRLSMTWLSFYAGVDKSLIADPSSLLHRTYDIAKEMFDVHYAVGYEMPLSQHPDCYASGFAPSNLTSPRDIVGEMRTRHLRMKTPDELWQAELAGKQRHLTGLFRGAYPASILSEAHLRSAALTSSGIGKLTELDSARGLWIWELSDSERPEAQHMLESRGVLVSQSQ